MADTKIIIRPTEPLAYKVRITKKYKINVQNKPSTNFANITNINEIMESNRFACAKTLPRPI